ncbi:DUF2950 family protein [Mesorhizobium sp.]|uniref:DUF2950 family protein n=1 Tax=Mesorhizobium sp. TaxID=1871066 RepID=UPI00338F935F
MRMDPAGVVYETDLGPTTEQIVKYIDLFNPDDAWQVVAVREKRSGEEHPARGLVAVCPFVGREVLPLEESRTHLNHCCARRADSARNYLPP